ncbi:2TM domain-containing protein [Maribacter sp. 2307UL18-2]|uniref:2TM domain-containing protein n=1 Tax=Maribacter sp. 2307UL18-2 TaxID=3386274 RepID=UPI0039BD5F37
MKSNRFDKFERARDRIAQIKGFYRHVAIFILINVPLILMKGKLGDTIGYHTKAMDWVVWNFYIWCIILAIHALLVFGKIPLLIRKWEERQIEKFMDDSKNEN